MSECCCICADADMDGAASGAVASSRSDVVQPRRASSMDDHHGAVDDGRAASAAGSDDGGAGVRSAHSSPGRGRRKITWLRKVIYCTGMLHRLQWFPPLR